MPPLLANAAVDLFLKGGPIMYPLLLAGLVGVAVVAERLLWWVRVAGRRDPRAVAAALAAAEAGDWVAADQGVAKSADPVARTSSRVSGVAAYRSQPTFDPKLMQEWVPGVKWGAPAFGVQFDESLKRRDEFLPEIRKWSSENLFHAGSAPIYFENNWGLTQPEKVTEMDYKVHSPAWGAGYQKLAQKAGVTCYLKYPDHPTEGFADIWDFIAKTLRK